MALKRTVGFNSTFRSVCSDRLLEKCFCFVPLNPANDVLCIAEQTNQLLKLNNHNFHINIGIQCVKKCLVKFFFHAKLLDETVQKSIKKGNPQKKIMIFLEW